jgi:negative regulator of flagellin synthesis FlgM
MNPIDNNTNIRTPRAELEQGTRRSADVSQNSSGDPAAAGAAAGAGDSVSLTQTAAELLQLETQLRELPGIDSARVASIRQSIDDGSYQIDTSSLVDSLLQSETELGG